MSNKQLESRLSSVKRQWLMQLTRRIQAKKYQAVSPEALERGIKRRIIDEIQAERRNRELMDDLW